MMSAIQKQITSSKVYSYVYTRTYRYIVKSEISSAGYTILTFHISHVSYGTVELLKYMIKFFNLVTNKDTRSST